MHNWINIILSVVALLLLFLIDVFTIKNNIGGGNGNLALLFIFLYVPILFWLLYQFILYIKNKKLAFKVQGTLTCISLALIIIGLFYHMKKYLTLKPHLVEIMLEKRGEVHYDYVDDIITGLTVYTNTIYFNFVTLLITFGMGTLLGILIKKRVRR
jgi:ABC-type sugar transport system permease subunit